MTDQPQITVFYDGECPVCRMEVRWYERIDKGQAIYWQDIGELSDSALPDGKSRDELLGIFHVRDVNGNWHVGVDAFARIWSCLPMLRHLAFLFSVPGLRQLAGLGYRAFLRWQRWHRARRHDKTGDDLLPEGRK